MKISVIKPKSKYNEFGSKYIKKILSRTYRQFDFVKNVDVEVRRLNKELISYLMNIHVDNNLKPITISYTTSNERDALIGAINATKRQLNLVEKYNNKNQEAEDLI